MRRFALVFLPLLIAYGGTLRWIWDSWMLPEGYYAHGPLLPVVAALVLWVRRAQWQEQPLVVDRRGWLLLGPGLFVHLAGAALTIDSMSAASLVLTLPGAVWLACGVPRLRAVWPVVLLIVFAVPMPIFMTGRVAFELKERAMTAALALCHGFGLDVVREGANLFVPPRTEPLLVADPCSGLRSLIALTTLGYCFAFLFGSQRGIRRWVLLAAAVPIAFACNVLRIAGVCWLASDYGVEWASTTGHDRLNAAAWILALVLLLAIDRALAALRGRQP